MSSVSVVNVGRPEVDAGRHLTPSVHLLAGFPTEGVRWALERVGDVMPVLSLQQLASFKPGAEPRLGILLPPFAEPASIVESWEAVGFLKDRIVAVARSAGVARARN